MLVKGFWVSLSDHKGQLVYYLKEMLSKNDFQYCKTEGGQKNGNGRSSMICE